jgi:hypothetical protein
MPLGVSSAPKVRAKERTAAFDAEYTDMSLQPTRALIDEHKITLAPVRR